MSEVTRILQSIEQGQRADELLPLVYREPRELAARKMAHEALGHTLQPTALVWQPLTNITLGPSPKVIQQPLDATNRFYHGTWLP